MELKTRQSFTDWVLQGQEDYENELLDSGFDSDDIDLIPFLFLVWLYIH